MMKYGSKSLPHNSNMTAKNAHLYHSLFCPFSRKITMGLREKKISFCSHVEQPWKLCPKVKELSLLGTLPILSTGSDIYAEERIICTYIDWIHESPSFWGASVQESTRICHIVTWFEEIFYPEIYKKIFYERVFKSFYEKKFPNPVTIRFGLQKLQEHLMTVDQFCEMDTFIVGKNLSWADIVAGSHLSCIDYIMDIPWDSIPFAKRWYMKIKSRPSFQPFLKERLPQVAPCQKYTLLDF